MLAVRIRAIDGNSPTRFAALPAATGTYDSKLPLVIDPTVRFTRFLSGSNTDEAMSIAFDGVGNSYVTGTTDSVNFPVLGGIGGNASGSDAFVTKLSPTGAVLFSTYLGGGGDDAGMGIAVDASGVYVTGRTGSLDFPVRQPLQPFLNGVNDAFVTKLSPLGNALVYSTFLGGSSGEEGWAITVDASQSAYVAGETNSKDFRVVRGYEFFPPGDTMFVPFNGFVAKLSPSGTSLVYSTYLGGSDLDAATAITIDSSLSAYVAGVTCSSDFPFAGLHSLAFPGMCTAFVTKLSPAGDSVIYSTYLPAANIQTGAGIALDASGNAYVTGTNIFGSGITAAEEVYATKVLTTGALGYFIFLRGNDGFAAGHGIATDEAGNAYVVGSTSSTSFPGAPPIKPNPTAGFLVKLDPNGVGPLYTTFLGLRINGVAVNKPRPRPPVQTFATIYTTGARFAGGTDASNLDAFVVKLDEAPVIVVNPVAATARAKEARAESRGPLAAKR
jgi:Beta-propeller repeat